jgi:hypothetical protein
MKKYYFHTILLIIAQQVMAGPKIIPPLAQTELGKNKFAEVSQLSATRDIRGLMKILPELELLWQEDPLGYLQSVSNTVLALSTSTDPNAAKSVNAALPRILEKRCPADAKLASFYFGIKSNIIGYSGRCMKASEKEKLLLINADFLSEIRSKRIPNYRNQYVEHTSREILDAAGMKQGHDFSEEAQNEALTKAIQHNKENEEMDRLQKTISTLDKGIVDSLIACAPAVSLPKVDKQKFYQELAKRATLTTEEQKKLETNQ